MGDAGTFPKTVQLKREIVGEADALGHAAKQWKTVGRCGARVWLRSATETATSPAEFGTGSLRLLLRMPPRTLDIGWHLVYELRTYNVVDVEYRDPDMLVTLDRI
jgi:head-tail adaptor